MFKKAFSLSEVLIVIAIIGVVATLTIPNLTRSYDEERTVTHVRKIYNELNNAYQQVVFKYGEYENWGNVTNEEKINRYKEFLEVVRSDNNVTFPLDTYNSASYTKCELKDGTILSFKNNTTMDNSDENSYFDVFVATNELDGTILGESIFGFTINPYTQKVDPFGKAKKGDDRTNNGKFSVSSNIYGTNWVITNGNLDYLKCANDLNWNNRTSCN